MHFIHMDFDLLASQLLRALRGKRSQPAFSRRLKYKSNVTYLWESGRAYPSFEKALEAAAVVGIDPVLALRRFFGDQQAPAWLDGHGREPSLLAPSLLDHLRGGIALSELARRSGFSRFAISRWLDGQTQPRLPQALALIEACTLRVLDFVAAFVDPSKLPSFAASYRDLLAARRATYELPFSQVVLHALEVEGYQRLPAHRPGVLARQLGISLDEEHQYLDALQAAGQVRFEQSRYRPTRVQTVDTRGDARRAAAVRSYFARLAVDRAASDASAESGYNVFAVSRADYARIAELQRSYYSQLRAIVASSQPAQVIALVSSQLLPLSARDANDAATTDR